MFYAYLPMHMCVYSRLNSRQCSHPVSFDVVMLLRVQLEKNLSSQGAKCAKHDWDFSNAKVVCKSMVHAEAMVCSCPCCSGDAQTSSIWLFLTQPAIAGMGESCKWSIKIVSNFRRYGNKKRHSTLHEIAL